MRPQQLHPLPSRVGSSSTPPAQWGLCARTICTLTGCQSWEGLEVILSTDGQLKPRERPCLPEPPSERLSREEPCPLHASCTALYNAGSRRAGAPSVPFLLCHSPLYPSTQITPARRGTLDILVKWTK